MSFTSEIKQEIAYNELKECCARAELSALVQFTSSLVIRDGKTGVLCPAENPTVMKRIVYLLKKHYQTKTRLIVAQKTNLKKNNVYTLEILEDPIRLLDQLGLYGSKGFLSHPSYQTVMKDCCARAYLAGAFLAYGSCNSPNKSNYHLEFSISDEDAARFIVKLIGRFNIEAKMSVRRKRPVVYVKKADHISDLLRLLGAHESLMNFENSRINRDFRNSLTRLDNCEIANEMKSLDAAKRQVEMIELIKKEGLFDKLEEKLRNAAEIRLKYPDDSLLELCSEYQKAYGESISKSGIKHRLNKIETIAKGLT